MRVSDGQYVDPLVISKPYILKRRITRISAWLFGLFFLFLLLFNTAPAITQEDEQFLNAFLREWNIELNKDKIHSNQESELAFLSKVQDSVLYSIAHYTIPFDSAGHVDCYFRSRKGLCFDRSLLLEKFCKLAGFNVRHLYIYFNGRGEKPQRTDIFRTDLLSHAMFEVKTKDGWMAMGTNSNWMGQDGTGQPLTIGEIRTKLEKQDLKLLKPYTVGQPFFEELARKDAFRFIYGVYSRHGQFLKSEPLEPLMNSIGIKSRVPDYNIRMLFANL